jgi:predicted nucleic-acid-binding protein
MKKTEVEIENKEIAENIEPMEPEAQNELLPSMNVSLQNTDNVPPPNIISDEHLLETFDEISNDLKQDREEVSEVIEILKDMVINDGDASSSTKESLVALIKIKTDIADKKTKIADLKTRLKMKEKDTFPRYLAANQNNHITIEKIDHRSLIEGIQEEMNNSKSKGN